MTSVFVLDTSILLAEGKKVLYAFTSNDVVIPYKVVKDLEGKRSDLELGYFAREVLKEIASLKSTGSGNISDGVSLGTGFGTLRVEVNHVDTSKLPKTMQQNNSSDIRILAVAHALQAEGNSVTLVTRDVTLQILADIAKVKSIALVDSSANDNDKYINKTPEFYVSDEVITNLYSKGTLKLPEIDVPINTGVLLKSPSNQALAIAKTEYKFDVVSQESIGKISSKSKEQAFAMDYLMDEDIGVVSLGGRAGSGKSMLALAAALELVEDKNSPYNKIVVFRPINAVGGSEQELGFLPGTIEEKLAPTMQPVFDTIGTFKTKIELDNIKKRELIEFRSIAHARGSTLSNCIIIVDEAQNLAKSTIGTLLTRAGIKTRVFLLWDVQQIDAHYVGKFDGIFAVVRFLLGKKLFAHISLQKSERSAVAEMSSGILEEM